MMWNYGIGGGGGLGGLWMTLMMVVVWGSIVAVAVWAIRSGLISRGRDPMDVLRRRFAAGEISQDDFEQAKRALQG